MVKERVVELHAVADAYRLLGVFLQLPTAEVAEGVRSGAVAADAKAIVDEMGCELPSGILEELAGHRGVDAGSALDSASDAADSCQLDELLSELRRDYTRLFTNPEHPLVPVYESVFKGSDDFDTSALVFVSPTALDAERAYREAGFQVDSAKHDSPDHMCAEVDFMCALSLREAEALEAGEEDEAAAARKLAEEFCKNHLLKWGEQFFALTCEHAATPAYRMVGALGCLLVGRASAGESGCVDDDARAGEGCCR